MTLVVWYVWLADELCDHGRVLQRWFTPRSYLIYNVYCTMQSNRHPYKFKKRCSRALNKSKSLLHTMARAKARAFMGVRGRCPQWGTERSGGFAPWSWRFVDFLCAIFWIKLHSDLLLNAFNYYINLPLSPVFKLYFSFQSSFSQRNCIFVFVYFLFSLLL